VTDVLVVGSGAGGVHAAWPLVERGLEVAMLDYGNEDREYASLVPSEPWLALRTTDESQHRYLLGDRFEGITLGGIRVGAQLTPPRLFIPADTERLTPVDSATFSATESLAKGGLAAGWGAGVFPFDDADLAGAPISAADLAPHYEAVAERIGVAGDDDDDLRPFLGECRAMMPAMAIDSGAERVMARYAAQRERLNAAGLFVGRTRLAACTREHRGRGPHRYFDMDFWADDRRAVYRPRWTLDELAAKDGFELRDRRLVSAFREDESGVVVTTTHADTGEREEHRARALVLAAGALGTVRIVLRSLDRYGTPVPILCNPYTYAPVLNVGMLGREARDERHSLAQLTAIYRPEAADGRIVQAQYYSYRSLLLFKLMKEAPIGHREARAILRRLQPVLGILGIHHEDRPSSRKTCVLHRGPEGGPDRLAIDYRLDDAEALRHDREERRLFALFRRLGCFALKRIRPGHGSAIHYAGTIPFGPEGKGLTCDRDCRVRGTRRVHLADGAVFPYLPAKGLTFTIMANADRVGTLLANELA